MGDGASDDADDGVRRWGGGGIQTKDFVWFRLWARMLMMMPMMMMMMIDDDDDR